MTDDKEVDVFESMQGYLVVEQYFCDKCKSYYSELPSTKDDNCKCGHELRLISVKLMKQGEVDWQETKGKTDYETVGFLFIHLYLKVGRDRILQKWLNELPLDIFDNVRSYVKGADNVYDKFGTFMKETDEDNIWALMKKVIASASKEVVIDKEDKKPKVKTTKNKVPKKAKTVKKSDKAE